MTSLLFRGPLVTNNPNNDKLIFPYVGGADVNSSPTHESRRFAINFGEMPEAQARQWPDLFSIVETKVKPERVVLKRKTIAERWWQYGEKQPSLVRTIRGRDRVLANSEVSGNLAFVFLPLNSVYSHTLNIFALSNYSAFCTVQSRVHEVWARFFGSSMKDDLRYTPSDCFETFPFPIDFETHPQLEAAGEAYYDFRAALMVKNNEGLTKTYNRFHDPNEISSDIVKLRELHAAIDRAVLDAYGWIDQNPTCEFLLDYEEDEDEEDNGGGRKRKKPWRYRWPDEFHDEILAKLLELNRQRAEEERLSGAAAEAKEEKKPRKRGTGKKAKHK